LTVRNPQSIGTNSTMLTIHVQRIRNENYMP
jgi:hypothetical protein